MAVLTMAAMTGAARIASAQEKKVKDQAEFDLIDTVKKDMLSKNGAKAVQDLDAWKQHNPDSEFKNDREVSYIQAYQLAQQWDKMLTKAKELMAQNLDSMFPDPKQGPQQVVTVYFGAVQAALAIQNPTADQLAIGVEAAHKLLDFSRKPEGISDTDWTTARKTLNEAANQVLYRAALAPAVEAEAKKDNPAAEAAWRSALASYPDKALISYHLGIALRAQHKDDLAIWQFARAAALDPTLGGSANGTQVTNFVNVYYKNLHGSPDGLDQIMQQAKASPNPPDGFHVETATEIAEKKQKEFETTHPDIALWMRLKATLTADGGQQYFDSGMKGAEVPELTGTVLESKCRAKELEVAIPLPDATGAPTVEITLKLVNDAGAASALPGKAETGRITFKGVAEAFSKEPFMLTMTIDKKDIKDLKVTPCAAPAGAKKGVTKKK